MKKEEKSQSRLGYAHDAWEIIFLSPKASKFISQESAVPIGPFILTLTSSANQLDFACFGSAVKENRKCEDHHFACCVSLPQGLDMAGIFLPVLCRAGAYQNHRVVGIGRDLWWSSCPAPLPSRVTNQAQKGSLMVRGNLQCSRLCPVPLGPALGTTAKSLTPSFLQPPFRCT